MRVILPRWRVLCWVVLSSCTSTPSVRERVFLTFRTEADPGVPISGVAIRANGMPLGASVAGELTATLEPNAKRVFRIVYDCPEGHADPVDAVVLRVRPFAEVRHRGDPGLEMTLRCSPLEHIAAFVVRAKNALSLPVLLNDRRVAEINEAGVAHFTARGRPGTDYVVRIDTSARPTLVPSSPERLFTLGDRHQVFVLDQGFEATRSQPRRRRRRPRIVKIE